MTKEQTLAAAEVMRRAAEGEPVEVFTPRNREWQIIPDPFRIKWNWDDNDYRIADPPPHGPNAHNPDGLSPTQVETHLGWRLLDRDEFNGPDTPMVDLWNKARWVTVPFGRAGVLTYRTKLTREELAEARGIRKAVPWSKHEHVPPLCWLRGTTGDHLVVYVGRCGVSTNAMRLTWKDLEIQPWEYSTDRVTWKPCTISE